MDTEYMRKIAMCIFIATDPPVADDVSKTLKWGADEIDQLNLKGGEAMSDPFRKLRELAMLWFIVAALATGFTLGMWLL